MKTRIISAISVAILLIVSLALADENSILVEKSFEHPDGEGAEVCPGDILDVRVRLTGMGEITTTRDPLNVVVVIDKSGSMGWDGWKGWNPNMEPPYGYGVDYPIPTPAPGSPDWGNSPYVETVWAAWKFYDYLIQHPPTYGSDYGALVFYGSNDYPGGVPGAYAVRTPAPISQNPDPDDPSHKDFWWHQHLAQQTLGGMTAMGPGMQVARDILGAMKNDHPDNRNVMVMMSDGFPNRWWTPTSAEDPANWPTGSNEVTRATSHAREIARRTTLAEALYEGGNRNYPQFWDSTIYTLGLGGGVNQVLMEELADPWNPNKWSGTPRPDDAHEGFYVYADTSDDIEDAFAEIARAISSEIAGENIAVNEIMPTLMGGSCPDGEPLITEIVEGSFSPEPDQIVPGDIWGQIEYSWFFDEIYIDQVIDITFQIRVLDEEDWPDGVNWGDDHLIECPQSYISFEEPNSVYAYELPILDPMFELGVCPTATPTATPTCIPGVVFYDDFESGDFSNWDAAEPDSGVRIYHSETYSNSGEYFVLFGGCEPSNEKRDDDICYGESTMFVFLDFSDPEVRRGPALELYLRPLNLSGAQKSGGEYELDDKIIVDVADEHGNRTSQEFNALNTYGHNSEHYMHVRMCLKDFAGSEQVRVRFRSYFPFTIENPQPWGNEPMIFVDDVLVYDYCYDPTPTPTPAPVPPQPIPATGRGGIGLALLVIGLLILAPMLRKAL
jgi:hypothetical protein